MFSTYGVARSKETDRLFLDRMAAPKTEAVWSDDPVDQNDSEAETEKLHESPIKKRLAEEIAIGNAKSVKLAGRDTKAPNNDSSHNTGGSSTKFELSETEHIETHSGPGKVSDGALDNSNGTVLSENESSDDEDLGEADEQGGEDQEDGDDQDDQEEGSQDSSDGRETNEERIKAIAALTEIEKSFSKIRDQLHGQQIAKFDLEIMMCSDGVHPELEYYNAQIDEERDERLRRNRSLLSYQINAIYNQSKAARCSAHQTYLKNKFQCRNNFLNNVTRKWYQINCEHQLKPTNSPQFGYVASTQPYSAKRPTMQSLGISTYKNLLGMPAAPHMPKATDSEWEEDLRNIGLR